jgi:pimeloyl-ACP methyl ester carboxylesterase
VTYGERKFSILNGRRANAAFELQWIPRLKDDALDCWLAVPADLDAAARPLVAVHGIRRNAKEQTALFGAEAAKAGRIVIAPLYDETRWPRYQQAVRKGRADKALLALLERFQKRDIFRCDAIDLFGFSGGAQFAHRFAMLHPERIWTLCVASAGWWTFPDAAPFPYGLGPAGERRDWGAQIKAKLDQFLRIPINVAVGARDCLADDNTRSGVAINMQQGLSRLARGRAWAAAVEKAGADRGFATDVRFHVLAACGHSFHECATRGGLDKLVFSLQRPRPLNEPNGAAYQAGAGAWPHAALDLPLVS